MIATFKFVGGGIVGKVGRDGAIGYGREEVSGVINVAASLDFDRIG